MNCQSCGQENSATNRFCGGCGAALTRACPSCQHANPPEQRFCGGCGAALVDGAAAARVDAASRQPQPPLPATFAAGRYQVQRFLGEGAKKRVYRAHDSRLDRDVAVALIKTEGLDDAGLKRVRREAQAMGRLGSHPHIVTVHDIIDEQGQPCIVQELMDGGSLTELIRSAPDRRLDAPTALRLAAEVARALSYAHQQGLIHRDVKPGNVWLTTDGRAKLGDFGLAVALDRTRLTEAGLMIGTVAYMPPEQALGGEITARSDLYSLGAMLYEMLTGRPPFPGEDTVSVISQHLNTPPLPPAMLNPQVPQGVETLVLRLLAKSPEERPASAEEVITALAALAAAPPITDATVPGAQLDPPRPRTGALRSPFVAREKELAQLKERLEDAIAGRGFLMMIVGEPGIGKTRLSEELSVYARLRGGQVLLGQCYESEGAPPYIPFVEALRQYVNTRPAEALREEMGDGASDLAKLVSEIRARVPNLPPAARQEPEAERYRLLEAVSSFLVNASKTTPLLLVLDDIHWADKPSLVLLQHLARRLPASRMLVVGTYRDIELDRRHPLSEVLGQLRRERLYERILLRGLDIDGVYALLTARAQLTATGKTEVERPFAAVLQEQTEGNPFFIEETIMHLVDVGAIYRQEDRWAWDAAAIQQNIPEGVREVIGRRLSRLSDAANQALTFASVLGREFDFDVLQNLSEMEEGALLSALEEALRAQLIGEHRASGGAAGGVAYRFTHALVQETLSGELSLARKQRLHLRAGRALEQARAGRLEPLVGQLAHHFYQGNDAAKAIDYCRKAGEAALRVYAWEDVVRHWEQALEVMQEGGGSEDDRVQLLERLGDVTYTSGIDYQKGVAFLEDALAIYERQGARAKAAAAHSRLGRAMVSFPWRLDLARGAPHLEAARAILEQDAPGSAGLAYVYCGICQMCSWTLEADKAAEYARRAREIGERLNARPVLALAFYFEGTNRGLRGDLGAAFDLLERSWRIAEEDNLSFVAFMAALFSASFHQYQRRDPQAVIDVVQRELDKPRLTSALQQRTSLLGLSGPAHVLKGDLQAARALSEGIASNNPLLRDLGMASGQWELVERMLLEGRNALKPTGDLNINALSGYSGEFGELYFLRGEHERAEEWLRAAVAILEQRRVCSRGLMPYLLLAQLLAKTGRIPEARQQLEAALRFIAPGDDWGGTAGRIALARGVIHAAEASWDEAEKAFEQALAVARQYGIPWDEADALHERARMHLARGASGGASGDPSTGSGRGRREALRLLDEAIAIYQRLGAKKHLELVVADKIRAQGIDSVDFQTSIDAVAADVKREHPDLRQHAAPDGTVTILFTDIEGSTQMTERLGDQKWLQLLREHNRIVREQLGAHGGFEVKSQGDGFMIAFQSARRALHCAIAIQRAFAARNQQQSEDSLQVRIGLHAGEAIKEADDFFGKNVILASRIAAQARGGEILVSSLVKELTHSSGDVQFGEVRSTELKGLSGTYMLHAVGWE